MKLTFLKLHEQMPAITQYFSVFTLGVLPKSAPTTTHSALMLTPVFPVSDLWIASGSTPTVLHYNSTMLYTIQLNVDVEC